MLSDMLDLSVCLLIAYIFNCYVYVDMLCTVGLRQACFVLEANRPRASQID